LRWADVSKKGVGEVCLKNSVLEKEGKAVCSKRERSERVEVTKHQEQQNPWSALPPGKGNNKDFDRRNKAPVEKGIKKSPPNVDQFFGTEGKKSLFR